ncbi:MAG: HEAT repeat domain-containing protein [Vampirovibrionales bacterium]|nr:HEAT repeat domain-containing protein [Vampirovibrionales bacterium]
MSQEFSKNELLKQLDAMLSLIQKAAQDGNSDPLEAIKAIGKLPSLLEDIYDPADHMRASLTLMDALRHGCEVSIMVHCLNALAKMKVPQSVSVMIDVLLATHVDIFEGANRKEFIESDNALRLRSAAAQALGKLNEQQAILALMSVLNDKSQNYRLRLAAAESLGKMGHENAITPLLEIVADDREKSVYLKESAVKALGMLGDIRAIEPLIDILESKRGIRDKFSFLKEQIIEAIGKIGRPHRKATDSLLYALKDEAPSIRLAAVESLAEIGDVSCLPVLQALIYDGNEDVACATVHAIYHLGGEEAIRLLLTLDDVPALIRDEMEMYIP